MLTKKNINLKGENMKNTYKVRIRKVVTEVIEVIEVEADNKLDATLKAQDQFVAKGGKVRKSDLPENTRVDIDAYQIQERS